MRQWLNAPVFVRLLDIEWKDYIWCKLKWKKQTTIKQKLDESMPKCLAELCLKHFGLLQSYRLSEICLPSMTTLSRSRTVSETSNGPLVLMCRADLPSCDGRRRSEPWKHATTLSTFPSLHQLQTWPRPVHSTMRNRKPKRFEFSMPCGQKHAEFLAGHCANTVVTQVHTHMPFCKHTWLCVAERLRLFL